MPGEALLLLEMGLLSGSCKETCQHMELLSSHIERENVVLSNEMAYFEPDFGQICRHKETVKYFRQSFHHDNWRYEEG